MLRTNLSTRPFYNARAVQAVLGSLALVVIAITLFNAVQAIRLMAQQRALSARAVQAEQEAQRLRRDAASIRSRIDPRELNVVAGQAREANAIIDQRTFSWTALLATFEATLPADVRITAVRPRLDKDVFWVDVATEAKRPEDLNAFIEALESSGAFQNVIASETDTSDDGVLQAVVTGIYVGGGR